MFKTISIFAAALFLSFVLVGNNVAQAGVLNSVGKGLPGLLLELLGLCLGFVFS